MNSNYDDTRSSSSARHAIPVRLAIAAILLFAGGMAWATTATNIQGDGTVGYWTNNANWNGASVPGSGAGESAYLAATAAIAWTNILDTTPGAPLATLAISNASGTACLIVTNAILQDADLFVRKGGILQIDNGGIVSNSATMTLSGTAGGAQVFVNSGGTLYPGTFTFGNLNRVVLRGQNAVMNGGGGGILTLGTSSALLLEDGAVATNIYRGIGSQIRTLTSVTGGSRLYTTNFVYLGYFTGGHWNTGLVSGAGSVWDMGGSNFYLGATASYSNLLLVADNGILTNVAGIAVAVTTFAKDNRIVVTNNGKIFSTGSILYGWEGAGSSAIVTGTGSVWDVGFADFSVGYSTFHIDGFLRVDRAGTVQRINTLRINHTPAVINHELQLWGGLVTASNVTCNGNQLFIGDGSQNAELRLLGGTATALSGVVVRANGILTGSGTFNGGIYGVVITNGAVIEPGVLTPGIITNVGDLTLAADSVSWFKILTNSVAGAGWDKIVVTNGALTLGGYLKPVLPGEFKPVFSNSFIIFSNRSADKITGTFNNGGGDRVNVYDINRVRKTGTFRIGVSNQYVVLDSYRPYSGGMVVLIK